MVEDHNKASGLDLRQPQGALAVGQWGLGNDDSNRWASMRATHCDMRTIVESPDPDAIGPLRGPILFYLAFPRPHEVFDLCALGFMIVKAAGLVQAFDLLNFPRTIIK